MRKLITGALAAATLGGVALTGTAASAAPWGYHGGWGGWHRGYGTGAVVGAGLLGLAAGVAIADRPAYGYGGYYRPYGYYGGYGYAPAYYGGCGTVWRWDPYVGHRVPVRRCW